MGYFENHHLSVKAIIAIVLSTLGKFGLHLVTLCTLYDSKLLVSTTKALYTVYMIGDS